MEKYLQYLLNDIDALIEQASPFDVQPWTLNAPPEEGEDVIPSRWTQISELVGLPAEVFPPEHFLNDLQVIELVENIGDLWTAWQLHWEMPLKLSARKQYTAMVREMEGAPVLYHPEFGADVHICDYEKGKCCPFQPGDNQCQCRDQDEQVKRDIALWEEYIDAQGLDPYKEITKEEEDLFDEEMRIRDLKKQFGENLDQSEIDFNLLNDRDLSAEDAEEILHAIEIGDELINLIWEKLISPDSDLPAEENDDEDEQ